MAVDEPKQWTPRRQLSAQELVEGFQLTGGTSKHLLILYSLAIGLKAKVIVELGLGWTTEVLRTAAIETDGVVYSCDFDSRRFQYLLPQQDDHWRLYLEDSSTFLRRIPEPFDFVLHDAAHHYVVVKKDLETIIPRMRKFGIICVHDTQQPNLSRDMCAAIRDATRSFSVSVTNLPFSAGMAIIRVEASPHPPVEFCSGLMRDGRTDTEPLEFATIPSATAVNERPTHSRWLAAKVRLAHILRQAGLKI